jgi:hypothetical protein
MGGSLPAPGSGAEGTYARSPYQGSAGVGS